MNRTPVVGVVIAAVALSAGLAGGASAEQGPQPTLASALKSAKAPASQLERANTVAIDGATITRYQQEVGGVPVLGSSVAVIDGPSSSPTAMTDSTVASVDAPPTAEVSKADAISAARAATGASGNRAAPTAELAVDPDHADALVQVVTLASKRPLQDFEVLVDAVSGEVLSKRAILKYATGTAKLYTPNPVVNNGGYSGIGTNGAADHHDEDTQLLTDLRVPVTLDNLKPGKCLKGKYVNSKLGSGSGRKVCKAGRHFNAVKRSQPKFEALMGYYHIDVITSYFHALGFTGTADVHPGAITSVANNLKADQSYYSPGDHMMHYGSGDVDDGEDGDVITHEYGHAVQDAQVEGFGTTDQAGGLGEGFGDFLSALNTEITPGLPNYDESEFCIFDWDGVGGYGGPGVRPCGRRADGVNSGGSTNTYSDALTTCSLGGGNLEVHCLGEVWSHGLIDLMKNIPFESGVPPIAKDVLSSQFAYSKGESFKNAVDDLVAADMALYGGTHVAAICLEMAIDRGIPSDTCP